MFLLWKVKNFDGGVLCYCNDICDDVCSVVFGWVYLV